MIGCGFYTGPSAAVACTGTGEEIIKRMLAKTVYDLIVQGQSVREAGRNGLRPFRGDSPVGVIAISKAGCAIVSNRQMAHYASSLGPRTSLQGLHLLLRFAAIRSALDLTPTGHF